MILAAERLSVPADWRLAALLLHLVCVVAGFGAVLTVDWFSLRWVLRLETIGTVLVTARGAHPLIWTALMGLVVSGTMLGPNTSAGLVRIKLLAVLLVGLNGVLLARAGDRLAAGDDGAPRSAVLTGAVAAGISQLGWWTATLIGFWNAHH
jgi:hypothetical protein